MPKGNEGITEILLWNFPRPLKVRFKAMCAKKQVSMHAKIIELIEEWTDVEEFNECSPPDNSQPGTPW